MTVPAPESETGVQTADLTELAPQWKLVLLDDDDHTYDYVVEMLVACCGLTRESAFRCAVEVDLSGETAVYYGTRAACRTRQDRIHAYGADPRMLRSHGSMRAVIRER